HDLVLVVMLEAVGIVAVAPVLGTPRRLHVRRLPGLGPDRTQEARGVEGARAHLHVVRLHEHAALLVPVPLELEDQFLEREHGVAFEAPDSTGFPMPDQRGAGARARPLWRARARTARSRARSPSARTASRRRTLAHRTAARPR